MTHVAVVETTCGNCGTELGGPFCQVCGQKATGPEVSLHDFFHEAFHEFAHVDGKIVQTLRLLLTKPGLLTKEFLSGRRARYISPLRVYPVCSVLFFALAALAPEAQPFVRVTKVDGEAGLDPAAVKQLRDAASAEASRAIVHDFPRVMFALMPAFGLLTWALYRKAKPFYVAHLYYSIHLHAFVFIALALSLVVLLVGGRYGRPVAGLVAWVILAYHFVSLRRVFGGSRLQAAWKGALLFVVYMAMVLAVMLAITLRSVKSSGTPTPAQHETQLRDGPQFLTAT